MSNPKSDERAKILRFGGGARGNPRLPHSSLSGPFFSAASPAKTICSVPVVVTNPDGQFDQLPNGFTYLDSSQVADPVVTGVEPAQGAAGGGYLAIVRGQQFVPGATVKFGGNAATSVEWISATMLKALVPAGAANNTVDVTVTNAPGHAGTMTGGFHYAAATVAPLTITAVSPGVGSTDGGTVITISGSGFADGSTVTVGTAPATGVNVVSSTTITAVTPGRLSKAWSR